MGLQFIWDSCFHHIKTSQLIWIVNQLTGFYLMEVLVLNESVSWMSSTDGRWSLKLRKLCFPKNFHTRILDEITVFYAVLTASTTHMMFKRLQLTPEATISCCTVEKVDLQKLKEFLKSTHEFLTSTHGRYDDLLKWWALKIPRYYGKRANLKTEVTRTQSTPNFPKNERFLPPDTHTYVCVSGGKKRSFFGKFGVLCILVTSVLRFALLPYYRRIIRLNE